MAKRGRKKEQVRLGQESETIICLGRLEVINFSKTSQTLKSGQALKREFLTLKPKEGENIFNAKTQKNYILLIRYCIFTQAFTSMKTTLYDFLFYILVSKEVIIIVWLSVWFLNKQHIWLSSVV